MLTDYNRGCELVADGARQERELRASCWELTALRFKLFVGEPLLSRVRGAAGTVFFLAREIVNLTAEPV